MWESMLWVRISPFFIYSHLVGGEGTLASLLTSGHDEYSLVYVNETFYIVFLEFGVSLQALHMLSNLLNLYFSIARGEY